LHIDYLAIIVEFDMDKNTFNPDAKLSSAAEVLKICSSLVTRMGDNTVQLAHASVQKYILEKKRTVQLNIVINPSMGNKFVGQCCLAYLLHSRKSHPIDDFHSQSLSTSLCERYLQSLIRYAAKYWPRHMLAANVDVAANEQIKELFVLTSFCFQNWVKVHNYELHFSDEIGMSSRSLLQCAAFHGLFEIVSKLSLDEKVPDLIAQGGHYGSALQAASNNGHKEIVQLLLESGADVNAQGASFGNALQAASDNGHKEIVQLLLERGANVNAQPGGHYGNALQAASKYGHKDIVQLLLESGAHVNAQGGYNGNALQAASDNGHKEIVHLLLERGAYVMHREDFLEMLSKLHQIMVIRRLFTCCLKEELM
jgi:hypothetical protein